MGSVLQQLNGPGPGPGPGPASGRRISWQKLAPAEDMQLRKRGEDAGKDIVRSLESLCKVWSHSEDSQLSPPHICNILTVSHHENERSSFYSTEDNWQPVSLTVDSIATPKNIGISVALIASFSILLIIAIYLAIKYRKKIHHTQVESREYEFDNLSRDQLVEDKYRDGPPDYYAAVLQKTYSDDSLPDYEDDMVRKVIV